jgi:hypothetical protein
MAVKPLYQVLSSLPVPYLVDGAAVDGVALHDLLVMTPTGAVIPWDERMPSANPIAVAVTAAKAGASVMGIAVRVVGASQGINGAPAAGASQAWNPIAFGCKWDNIHDDSDAFQAMLRAIPVTHTAQNANQVGGAVIECPQGFAYFSKTVEIARPVSIRGCGAGGGPAGSSPNISGIRTPAGVTPFVLQGGSVSSDGGTGDNAEIMNLIFTSELLIQNDAQYCLNGVFKPNFFYPLGETLRYEPGTNTAVFFRCTQAGTSGAVAPAEFGTTTLPGVTITSGTTVWTSEAFPHDRVANQAYTPGQRIFVPGDTRFYFECRVGGTSDVGTPANSAAERTMFLSPQLPPDDVDIVDGTVHWRPKAHMALWFRATECVLRNIWYAGFTGYCVHAQSTSGFSPTPAFCNNLRSYGGKCETSGGGMLFYGEDAGLAHIESFYAFGCADIGRTSAGLPLGTGGHAIYDNGLVNNFYSLYASNSHNGGSPANYTTGLAGGKFIGCQVETSTGEYFSTPASMQFGGSPYQAGSSHVAIMPNGGQNLFERNFGVTPPVNAYAGVISGNVARIHKIFSDDEVNQGYAWEYQNPRVQNDRTAVPYTGSTGWYTLGWGSDFNLACIGISGATAAEGKGHWREYEGRFCGGTSPYWHGNNLNSLGWGQLRGGAVVAGDRWANANAGAPGGYDTLVANADVTAPYVARVWAPSTQYWAKVTGVQTYTGHLADVVVPTGSTLPPAKGTKVFRVKTTVNGVTGTSKTAPQPAGFTTVTTIGDTVTDNDITWEYIGNVPSFAATDLVAMPGTLTLSADTALSTLQAAYECIVVDTLGKTITVTSPRDGALLRVFNSTSGGGAGNITVVGITVGTQQMLTAQFVGGAVNAWKKVSLV